MEHLLAGHPIDPGALRELGEYRWTRGNVRELKAVLARARQLAAGSPIRPNHFRGTEEAPGGIPLPGEGAVGGSRTLKVVTRRHVLDVLEGEGGNRSPAARVLGIDRRTLYRMLARWETGGDGA